jgi:hypothetical protein
VNNEFIQELRARGERQVAYTAEPMGEHEAEFRTGPRGRPVWLTPHDAEAARGWVGQGFTETMRTPDSTLIFVTPDKAEEIRQDQINCMGCLSSPLQQLGAARARLQQRQAGRSALLHPEDAAGHHTARTWTT